jgi:acyl-CoA hydrolase
LHAGQTEQVRTLSVDDLSARLQALRAGEPRVVASGNHAVPWQLLDIADRSLQRYRLFMLNAPTGVPDRDGVTLETPFVGVGMRGKGGLAYYPCRLSLVPALLKERALPDVVMLHVAPPRHGLVSLGVEVNVLPAAVEAARAGGGLVVAQVNPRMPYTSGDALLSADEIDIAVEVDCPLGELPRPPIGDVQRVIGEHVAALVPDGATLQLGIGGIPDATLDALPARRGLRVWSEMISDGVLQLEQAGALADDPITTSFAAGSQQLYDWLHDNPRVTFCRTERANDPAVIAHQPTMTSINAALQVDLFAQANASYVHGRIHSGFGGQTDFIVGALHATHGHAIIALPSWHQKSATSTIVDHLHCPATSFQHSYVVTEQGVASIWGRPQREQAAELIEHAAAPQAREALRASATTLF